MKAIYHFLMAGTLCCAAGAALTSCSDVLDEQPRTIYDPSFFETDKGIDGGLASLYANLRNVYGNGNYLRTPLRDRVYTLKDYTSSTYVTEI